MIKDPTTRADEYKNYLVAVVLTLNASESVKIKLYE